MERFLDSSTPLPGGLLRLARQRPSNDTTSLDITASRSLNETRRFNVQVACFLSFKRLRWLVLSGGMPYTRRCRPRATQFSRQSTDGGPCPWLRPGGRAAGSVTAAPLVADSARR